MNKREFWNSLNDEQKAFVVDCKNVKEILKTFDGSIIAFTDNGSGEVWKGVEPLPEPDPHEPFTAYRAYER